MNYTHMNYNDLPEYKKRKIDFKEETKEARKYNNDLYYFEGEEIKKVVPNVDNRKMELAEEFDSIINNFKIENNLSKEELIMLMEGYIEFNTKQI